MRAALGLALLIVAFSSCSDELVGEGGKCTSSAECGPGLLCDVTLSPPICVRMGGVRPDLSIVDEAVPVDLAGADLAGLDLSVVDEAVPADLTPPPDLAEHD